MTLMRTNDTSSETNLVLWLETSGLLMTNT
jgi:hypothetical protein